ncbi:MAG: CBS domain-containing protein [Bradymonadales bacterium]|nr:CBS domain-containing protein [Bradymonadales bacterium]
MSNSVPNIYDIDMPVRAFVTKRLIGIDSKKSVQDAAKLMVQFDISSLVAMEGEKVVGFLTDADIKRKVVAQGLPTSTTVDQVMESHLITIDIGTRVRDVLGVMSEKNIKHLLVEDRGVITGIVTFRDLIDIERHKLETYISRE